MAAVALDVPQIVREFADKWPDCPVVHWHAFLAKGPVVASAEMFTQVSDVYETKYGPFPADRDVRCVVVPAAFHPDLLPVGLADGALPIGADDLIEVWFVMSPSYSTWINGGRS